LQGVSSRGQNNTIPQGAQLGLGVRTAAIRNLNLQGTLTNTGWVGRQSGYDCSGERRECQRQPVGSGDGDHPNQTAPQQIGQLTLANFANDAGLLMLEAISVHKPRLLARLSRDFQVILGLQRLARGISKAPMSIRCRKLPI